MCSAPYFSNERLIYMKSQQQRGGEETGVVGLCRLRSTQSGCRRGTWWRLLAGLHLRA